MHVRDKESNKDRFNTNTKRQKWLERDIKRVHFSFNIDPHHCLLSSLKNP